MTADELWEALESDELLEYVGCDHKAREVFVRVHGQVLALSADAVAKRPWSEVRAVLLGERHPEVLRTYARIVGYFSRTSNWNRSKLTELRDRGKGDYGSRQ